MASRLVFCILLFCRSPSTQSSLVFHEMKLIAFVLFGRDFFNNLMFLLLLESVCVCVCVCAAVKSELVVFVTSILYVQSWHHIC
jgi:hypothetical protein